MARYSGGPVTHRALTGPRTNPGADGHQREVAYTLTCIQEVRTKIDQNELRTVKIAREAGLSWTEIATALGIARQSAWEKWHEIDEARD
jgi:predicted transcriptional regulator